MKLKTLVEAQEVIDRLLAMHLEAVLKHPNFVQMMNDAKEDRVRAHMASFDLRMSISPMLNQKVEIHD